MAIRFGSGFQITSKQPIDTRLILSKAEMYTERYASDQTVIALPDHYMCVCKDDNQVYVYDSHNAVLAGTGKFRPAPGVTAGDGIKVEDSKVSIDLNDNEPTAIRLRNAVEKVENGNIYQAGQGIDIENKEISLDLSAGEGIEINGNKISIQDLPQVTLNQVIIDESIKNWIRKGYPLRLSGRSEIFNQIESPNVSYYIYYSPVLNISGFRGYKFMIDEDSFRVDNQLQIIYQIASASMAGQIMLVSDTRQSVAPNEITATENRTYAIQLNSDGQAVVNVPWNSGSISNLYQHDVYVSGSGYNFNIQLFSSSNTKIQSVEALLNAMTDQINYPCTGTGEQSGNHLRLITCFVKTSNPDVGTFYGMDFDMEAGTFTQYVNYSYSVTYVNDTVASIV